MTIVYNLLTGKEHHFSEGTDALKALKVAHALDNGKGSQLATEGVESIQIEIKEGKHCLTSGELTVIKNW